MSQQGRGLPDSIISQNTSWWRLRWEECTEKRLLLCQDPNICREPRFLSSYPTIRLPYRDVKGSYIHQAIVELEMAGIPDVGLRTIALHLRRHYNLVILVIPKHLILPRFVRIWHFEPPSTLLVSMQEPGAISQHPSNPKPICPPDPPRQDEKCFDRHQQSYFTFRSGFNGVVQLDWARV